MSAVIPTRNRSDLVSRAVASALAQTFERVEVVVVIDGPDSATAAALSTISDPRLHVISLDKSIGGSAARNAGVCAARGKWIAFLDDDDEWLEQKIWKQFALAEHSEFAYPIIATGVIARRADGDLNWPRKPPKEPLSEYLLARSSWSYGEGLMLTTTLFASKELLLRCAFTPGLKRYQDWDWLLRSIQHPGAGIEFIAEPLAIWHIPADRPTVSRSDDWEFALSWLQSSRDRITPRAYAGFIATVLAPQAAAQHAWHAFVGLFWEMIRAGEPKLIDYALYLGMWLPIRFRRKLARSASKKW